ncbi:hypothetical protein Tco_1186711 [Tanacetum coccineum]
MENLLREDPNYVQQCPNAGWFTKKSRPSTVAIAKKLKELIQKDELTIADLEGAGLEKLKKQYKNDVELEYHVDQLKAAKYATSLARHFAARYLIQGIEDMIHDRWSKEVYRYQIEALNGIHHWEDGIQDFFKAKINNRSPYKIYSNNRIILVIRVDVKRKWGYGFLSSIVVRRSNKKEYTFSYADLPRLNLNDIEDMYMLKVQDKKHHLQSEFEIDFNNVLLLFIQRTVILNRGIEDKIPYTMSGTEKGVAYLNQHNHRSLMNLNEVHKFYDGTLMKIHENLIEMVNKNKLGRDNKRLKGRDCNDKDIKRSNEMLDKIDQTLKRREQLRRLEEYVGGRPKTIDPHFYIRP